MKAITLHQPWAYRPDLVGCRAYMSNHSVIFYEETR